MWRCRPTADRKTREAGGFHQGKHVSPNQHLPNNFVIIFWKPDGLLLSVLWDEIKEMETHRNEGYKNTEDERSQRRARREREYGDVNGARSRLRIPQKRNKWWKLEIKEDGEERRRQGLVTARDYRMKKSLWWSRLWMRCCESQINSLCSRLTGEDGWLYCCDRWRNSTDWLSMTFDPYV